MIPYTGISIWMVVKYFMVFGFLIYLVFALVVVKQSRLMLETLEIDFEKPILALVYLHLLFAVGVLLLSLIIL